MNTLKSLFGRRSEKPRRSDRTRRFGLEMLEGRQLLSTVVSNGAFDGMTYSYTYDNVAKTGFLQVTSTPGSHTIDVQSTHPNLSPGDPGYDPAKVNDIVGIEMTDRQNSLSGGVNVVDGTRVTVKVLENTSDNQFVNDEPHFAFSTVQRSAAPVVTPPDQSGNVDGIDWKYAYNKSSQSWTVTLNDAPGTDMVHLKTVNHQLFFVIKGASNAGPNLGSGTSGSIVLYQDPNANQMTVSNETGFSMTKVNPVVTTTGTTQGLGWRYVYNQATNNGSLYIQDTHGSDSVYLHQSPSGVSFLRLSNMTEVNGPAVTSNARVNIIVARTGGDNAVIDDRDYSMTSYIHSETMTRALTGNVDGVSYSYSADVVANTANLTFVSAAGGDEIDVQASHLDLSPGDPGYVANQNPINGIHWSVRSKDGYDGGVNTAPGARVTITAYENLGQTQIVNGESTFTFVKRTH